MGKQAPSPTDNYVKNGNGGGKKNKGGYSRIRPWGDQLPDLVLDNIVRRLDCISTYVTFACVCRAWRAFAKAAAADFLQSQPPMLVHFLESAAQDCTMTFYGLVENKIYQKRIEGLIGLRYVGHSHGWLLMARRICNQEHVVLLNPFSGANIEFPSIRVDGECVDAGVLSAPPTSSDCLLFGVTTHHIFYYYRSASAAEGWGWRILRRPRCMASRVEVFFIKNRVYAATKSRLVTVMDINGANCTYLFSISPPAPARNIKHMEVGGDVWAFRLKIAGGNVHRMDSYRLDSPEGKWVEAEFHVDRSLFLFTRGSGKRVIGDRRGRSRTFHCDHTVIFSSGRSHDGPISVKSNTHRVKICPLQWSAGESFGRTCKNIRVSWDGMIYFTTTVREVWLYPQNCI